MPKCATFKFSTIQNEYETYLSRERGLAAATSARYWWVVSRFLVGCSGKRVVDPGAIGAAQISAFVMREASKARTRTIQVTSTALRSFLRFLFRQGRIAVDLAGSVPAARSWQYATLPRYLPADQVERLLESCKRTTSIGRRDYAILLLLARLGLRAPEVVALTLDDVDWRAGEIIVRGKGNIHERLPLPQDVGEWLAAYLRHDRRGTTRRLFVREKGPRDGFKNSEAINEVLKRALRRTGLQMPAKWVGSHVLRHSLATSMLRSGASLREIGEVLRHRSANTTVIYAKVDIDGLRSIAKPWPIRVQP